MIKYDPATIKFYRHVEIHPELTGTSGINFAPYRVSAPRLHMLASHMGQKPVIIHGEPARVATGAEREYAKYLYTIETPCRMRVINIINNVSPKQGSNQNPPLTVIIYENIDDNTIGVLRVPHNYANHQTFGFRYIRTKVMTGLYVGADLDKGTLLAHPDTLGIDGDWNYGINVRMGLIQSEAGIEDGLAISETTARRLAMYGYGTVTIQFSETDIPLGVWGDDKRGYDPIPQVGDIIPPSGIIMASREYDPDLAPANMSRDALSRPNNTDNVVKGMPGARIVDVRVIRSSTRDKPLPKELDSVMSRHWEKNIHYYEEIIRTHKQLTKLFGTANYPATPEMFGLVKDALFIVDPKKGLKKESYRGTPLDDTMVIVQYEYIYIPKPGSKITARQGDKAVVTVIKPDHMMPKCARGIPLGAYMDDISTINRMNGVRWDEITFNACMETVTDMIRDVYHGPQDIDAAWNILMEAVDIIAPINSICMREMPDHERIEDINTVLADQDELPPGVLNGIRMIIPTDNPIDYVEAIPYLEERFPPVRGPLEITKINGEKVMTKFDSLVSWFYIFPLERQATNFAATSSSMRQHHGIPVKPSKTIKMANLINDSPTKDKCEDSTRGYAALLGGNIIAENYDRNLNPRAHQQECRSIYHSRNPARITNTVPRHESQLDPTVEHQEVIPVSGGRVNEIREHIQRCGGVEFIVGEDGDAI